jgi:stearoyl-CoA desaturase (Delta-9 desaturase)
MQDWIYGVLNLSWVGYIIITLAFTHLTIIGVTLFLHRSQAHRACGFHPIVSHILRFWLWLTTGMVTKEFVSIHRKHHAKCETEDDPHSPQIEGIDAVLWSGVELYRLESRKPETMERFGQGTPDDWIERNLYTRFNKIGILFMFIADCILLGAPGITVWAIQMMWIPFMATGVINGIGHYWGYRNYECGDASTNVSPWGIIIGGEELHNNHHAFGTSAKLSVKWYEFDIGWFYLKTLSLFGLATIKRLPPKPYFQSGKNTIDVDTIKAMLTNRFQVFSSYTKRVVMPVFEEARRKAAGKENASFFTKVKHLFKRHESLVDACGKERMENVMNESSDLKRVYEMRQSLMSIWTKTTASQKELIEAVQMWCQHAEETGIDVLKEFVVYVKSYTMPQVAAISA